MATNFKQYPNGGFNLVPRSTDPSSPAEGDIQCADGTARAAGLWQYLGSAWKAVYIADFVGDSGSGGTRGIVPAPATGDSTKFLKGNGTWATPSTAAATPVARYTTAAGQNTTTGVATIIDFGTSSISSTNVTTGAAWKYTVATGEDGKYEIDALITLAAVTSFDVTEAINLMVYKNGAKYSTLRYQTSLSSTSINYGTNGSDILNLVATDYIDIRVIQNSGATVALLNDAEFNHVTIKKVG
jgi:hypothetical protein